MLSRRNHSFDIKKSKRNINRYINNSLYIQLTGQCKIWESNWFPDCILLLYLILNQNHKRKKISQLTFSFQFLITSHCIHTDTYPYMCMLIILYISKLTVHNNVSMFFELTTTLDSNFKNLLMEHSQLKEYSSDYTEKYLFLVEIYFLQSTFTSISSPVSFSARSRLLCMAKQLGRSFVTEHKGTIHHF